VGWRGLTILLVGLAVHSAGCDDPGSGADGGVDAGPDGQVALDARPDAGDGAVTDCPWPDLAFAPAPKVVDGLYAVPVDIQTLDGTVVLDGYQQTGRAGARVTFRLGSAGGMPILDLRQTPDLLELDGEPISPQGFAHHDFGAQWHGRLRVVERSLAPCTSHTLVVDYDLGAPASPEARPVDWAAGSSEVRWDFWFTDLEPGRYLEMWFPANLIYDRFTFGLALDLRSDADHAVISNAEVFDLGPGLWQLEFPPYHTALSPMVVVRPRTDLVSETRTELFGNGQSITIEVHRLATVADTDPPLMDRVVTATATAIASTGDYPHGERLVVYVWDEEGRSMEYDGGTTTGPDSLEHELFHSWFGRGVRPALGRDGWMDEAWTVFNTDEHDAFEVAELPATASPMVLDDGNPWGRITPGLSYEGGRLVFAHLAFLMGLGDLRTAMAGFYAAHVPDPVRTADLERHLYCFDAAAADAVARAFWRYVYGESGDRDPATYPTCP